MRFSLPEKHSPIWLHILSTVFVATLMVLLLSQGLLGIATSIRAVLGFGVIACIIALLTCLGYFGAAIFSLSVVAGDILGAAYLFWAIFTNRAPIWLDLTGVTEMLIIVCISTVLGLVLQIIVWIKHRNNAPQIVAPIAAAPTQPEVGTPTTI